MMNFNDMLQAVRNLKPGEGTAYVAYDVPVKACVNFWLELDAAGKVTHFTPHLNFYVGEEEEDYQVTAVLRPDDEAWNVDTKLDASTFLQAFARQSGLDQQAQVWERDETADV